MLMKTLLFQLYVSDEDFFELLIFIQRFLSSVSYILFSFLNVGTATFWSLVPGLVTGAHLGCLCPKEETNLGNA